MDSSAPVFQFFRTSADNSDWGLRDGEFASREAVNVALSSGVTIFHLLERCGLSLDSQSDEGHQLQGMYLTAGVSNDSLYDQFANGHLHQGNPNIQNITIGLSLPVPVGNLPPGVASFGYGYSPESTLERTGQFYSAYVMSF